MRDVATLNQLLVLANLESYNAVLISQGKNQKERMELLRQLAVQQLQTLEMISLNKLLDNYNPMGIPIAFLGSYLKCKKEDFDNYWIKYRDYLKHCSSGRFLNHFVCEHKQTENYLRLIFAQAGQKSGKRQLCKS